VCLCVDSHIDPAGRADESHLNEGRISGRLERRQLARGCTERKVAQYEADPEVPAKLHYPVLRIVSICFTCFHQTSSEATGPGSASLGSPVSLFMGKGRGNELQENACTTDRAKL
jgi:hypothetical protein